MCLYARKEEGGEDSILLLAGGTAWSEDQKMMYSEAVSSIEGFLKQEIIVLRVG